jgi:hypothetical protein
MSPTIAGRRAPERKTAACPVTFLIWAIGFWAFGGASAAEGIPAAAIDNAAAKPSSKPDFFLPANFLSPWLITVSLIHEIGTRLAAR